MLCYGAVEGIPSNPRRGGHRMDKQPGAPRDPLVDLVEKKIAAGADAQAIVVDVLAELAEQVPEHFGGAAQQAYRRWLRRKSQLVEEGAPYERAYLAGSWQWE